MAISGQLWCQFFSRSHYFSHKLSHNLNLFIPKTFFSYIFLIRCFLVAIHILFLDKSFDFVGGNCGEAGGRPFYEPRFDRSPGEGGRLLCCLYRSVSPSSLSFSLFLEQKRRYSSFPPQMTPSHFLSHRPYHCHRFSRHLILCPTFPTISCSGIASIGLMNHKHGFFFWLSCFSWVGTKNCDIEYWVVFRSCLGSGQNLWQKRGPTPKCHPR